jgi:hypothetical protein
VQRWQGRSLTSGSTGSKEGVGVVIGLGAPEARINQVGTNNQNLSSYQHQFISTSMTGNKLSKNCFTILFQEYPNNIQQDIEKAWIKAISIKFKLTSPCEINIDESKVGVKTRVQLHS